MMMSTSASSTTPLPLPETLQLIDILEDDHVHQPQHQQGRTGRVLRTFYASNYYNMSKLTGRLFKHGMAERKMVAHSREATKAQLNDAVTGRNISTAYPNYTKATGADVIGSMSLLVAANGSTDDALLLINESLLNHAQESTALRNFTDTLLTMLTSEPVAEKFQAEELVKRSRSIFLLNTVPEDVTEVTSSARVRAPVVAAASPPPPPSPPPRRSRAAAALAVPSPPSPPPPSPSTQLKSIGPRARDPQAEYAEEKLHISCTSTSPRSRSACSSSTARSSTSRARSRLRPPRPSTIPSKSSRACPSLRRRRSC